MSPQEYAVLSLRQVHYNYEDEIYQPTDHAHLLGLLHVYVYTQKWVYTL